MGYLDKALEAMQEQGGWVSEPIKTEPTPMVETEMPQRSTGELIKAALDRPSKCRYCGSPIVFVEVIDWFDSTGKIKWATLSTGFTSFHRCVKYDFVEKDD
jgi:hypothetical protein